MSKKVSGQPLRVVDRDDVDEIAGLPDAVVAEVTSIAEAAREGLLAMSVTAGLRSWPRSSRRTALGCVARRPRARYVDGSGVPLESWAAFSDESLLDEVVFERMVAGLATRRHRAANEPVGADIEAAASGTSKSVVSRRWVRAPRRLSTRCFPGISPSSMLPS